jgi:ribosomal protein L17
MSLQELIEIIDIIALFLEPEQQQKVLMFKEMLTTFSQEEIESFIEKIKDVKGTLNKAIIAAIDAQIAKVTAYKTKVDNLNKVSKVILADPIH